VPRDSGRQERRKARASSRAERREPRRLRLVSETQPEPAPQRQLRIVDVALFYGERSGGIRTYLEAKADFARRSGRFEHHLVIPGRPQDGGGDAFRHEQRSLRLAASNGYRLPLGGAGLQLTLRRLRPDVVLLHDPYWSPRLSCRAAHELGATVIAVHHSSAALHAGVLPGPQELYKVALRRWYRRAYLDVDGVMSVVDPGPDAHRACTLPLRLGLDPAFRPHPDITRGDHVLYVGRLSREKGVRELLEAAAGTNEHWRLVLRGTGPAGDALEERATALGLAGRVEFAPFISDRASLAREYAGARCVVLPGPHETFGLVALEAAACGAPVVTASSTPAAEHLDGLVDTFAAGDANDLRRAIARSRARVPDLDAAARIVKAHSWDAALEAEIADLEGMLALRRAGGAATTGPQATQRRAAAGAKR
jgi:alpha-1,6-mannosyltransferase